MADANNAVLEKQVAAMMADMQRLQKALAQQKGQAAASSGAGGKRLQAVVDACGPDQEAILPGEASLIPSVVQQDMTMITRQGDTVRICAPKKAVRKYRADLASKTKKERKQLKKSFRKQEKGTTVDALLTRLLQDQVQANRACNQHYSKGTCSGGCTWIGKRCYASQLVDVLNQQE